MKWFIKKWLNKNLDRLFLEIQDTESLYVKQNPNKTIREWVDFSDRKNRLIDLVLLLKLCLEDDHEIKRSGVQRLLLGKADLGDKKNKQIKQRRQNDRKRKRPVTGRKQHP